MNRFVLDWRKVLLWVVVFFAILGGVFLFLRRGFDPNDVVTEFVAPSVATAGEEGVFTVLVRNGSSVSLRDVRITMRFPQSSGAEQPIEAFVGDLPSREQATREIRTAIPVGQETVKAIAIVRFRAGIIPAAFERTHEAEIFVSAAPVDLSFSFPSDVGARQQFTFFVRWRSQATGAIPRIGLRLTVPSAFHISRTRPDTEYHMPYAWNLGDLAPGVEGEIAVTGAFDGESSGEFLAELGTLNESNRDIAMVLKDAREFRKFAQDNLTVTLRVQDVENPGEVIALPSEAVRVVVDYHNASPRTLDDVSLVLGFSHPAIDQRSVSATPLFQRRPSGEYAWGETTISTFAALPSGVTGQIVFFATLNQTILMSNFQDANQSIPLELKAFAEGKLQAQRASLVKIGSRLQGRTDAYFQKDPDGYDNSGTLPPRVGQETTTTVQLSVIGGTNGFRGTTMRLVLGPGTNFRGVVSSDSASVKWNPETREFVWEIGDLIAGTGILSPPKKLVIRVGTTPLAEDAGKPVTIVESGLLTGEDSWTGRTSDFTFEKVGTTDIADQGFVYRDGIVVE